MVQTEIRTDFLKEFVMRLMINSDLYYFEHPEKSRPPFEEAKIELNLKNKEENLISQIVINSQRTEKQNQTFVGAIKPIQQQARSQQPFPLKKSFSVSQPLPTPKPIMSPKAIQHPNQQNTPYSQSNFTVTPSPQIQPPNVTNQHLNELGLGAMSAILMDPAVLSVECPGPGKPILVNKSGITQTTSTTLTAENITSIIGGISNKTKIPIISGLFKAAFDNFVITAVVSDFVGTRFVIQKIGPFMQLM